MTTRSTRRHRSAAVAIAAAARPACEALEQRQLFSVSLASAVPVALSTTPAGDPTAPVPGAFDAAAGVDVVVAFPSPTAIDQGYVQFAANNGTGTLATRDPAVVGIFTGRPVAADFDGDGKLDLAVTDAFNGVVRVLRGNGDGTFAAAQEFDAGVSPEALAAGDFNKDGKADLAVGNRSDNTVDVYFGDAAATLAARVTLNTAADPATVAIADFNGDNDPDLLVGASGGTGATAGALQVFPWTVPSIDTDGDGVPDSPSGAPGSLSSTPVATAGPRGATAVGDLDGDGFTDVVVGVSDADKADALVNTGGGAFQLIPGATGSSGTKAAVAADLDEDGDLDLVTAVAGRIDVLANDGLAQFSKKPLAFDAAGGSGPAVADVNGDGRNDVLTITATPGQTSGRTLNVSVGQRVGPEFAIELVSGVTASALSGQTNKIVVRVTNNGNEAFAGNLPVSLVLSPDATPGNDDDSLLLQAFPKVKLKPGKAKTLKFKAQLSVGVGTYNFFAQVDPRGSAGDLDRSNNATAALPVVVADPFVDLVGTLGNLPATPVTVGQKLAPDITVTNNGNITGAGKMRLFLLTSADQTPDQADVVLQAFDKKVKLAPGRSTRIKFKFKLPTNVTPGTYYVLGLVNENGAIAEPDPDNNVAVGATQLVVQ
ncbi:MAG TPA: VCBS repeat-containing protein [Humisphaera sp.]